MTSTSQSVYEQMNAKYGAFVVTRYSPAACRQVRVGKVHPTIQAALASAKRIDERKSTGWMTFVDLASAYVR